MFGDIEGDHRNPEHVSRQFARDIARARAELGDQALPVIRLHDLRHTHATILLTDREPVHVVSQRLGHASAVVTMTVYAHVLPGSQREAAGPVRPPGRGGEIMTRRPQASDWHQGSVTEGITTLSPAGMSCPRGDLNPHALYGH